MPHVWSVVGPAKGDATHGATPRSASVAAAAEDSHGAGCGDDEGLCALVASDTATFRRMVGRVRANDVALEIGSSWGVATNLLGKALRAPNRVVGIDTSKEAVEASRARFPQLHFERADALGTPLIVVEIVQRLLERCSADGAEPQLVVFVDIGGNREIEALVALLPWVASALPKVPRLIVVKSEALHSAVCANQGEIDWTALQAVAAQAPHQQGATGPGGQISTSRKLRLLPHPLKATRRFAIDGQTPICRFHNYRASSCREGAACPYDHAQCHLCLKVGHRALECKSKTL